MVCIILIFYFKNYLNFIFSEMLKFTQKKRYFLRYLI
jgi:hypothetical protein